MPNPMSKAEIVELLDDYSQLLCNVQFTSSKVKREKIKRAIEHLEGMGADAVEFTDYDAGALNDWGGGNVGWWQDYIRAEIERANDHWHEQTGPDPLYLAPPAQAASPSRDDIIQVLLSTQSQSEGVTADVILSLMGDVPAQAARVPEWFMGKMDQHALAAGECPPNSKVVLLSSIERLNAAPAPVEKAVPDGWQLVPVEPTKAMRYSVENTELAEFCTSSRQSRHHDLGVQVYKAMLAVAPAPAEKEPHKADAALDYVNYPPRDGRDNG